MKAGNDKCRECWLEANRLEVERAKAEGGSLGIPLRTDVERKYLDLLKVNRHAHSDHYRRIPGDAA